MVNIINILAKVKLIKIGLEIKTSKSFTIRGTPQQYQLTKHDNNVRRQSDLNTFPL